MCTSSSNKNQSSANTAVTKEPETTQQKASTSSGGNAAIQPQAAQVTVTPEPEAILGKSNAAEKYKKTGLAGRDTRTGARGLADSSLSRKKELLGG